MGEKTLRVETYPFTLFFCQFHVSSERRETRKRIENADATERDLATSKREFRSRKHGAILIGIADEFER